MNLEAIPAESIGGEDPGSGDLIGSCDRSPREAPMVPEPGKGAWR